MNFILQLFSDFISGYIHALQNNNLVFLYTFLIITMTPILTLVVMQKEREEKELARRRVERRKNSKKDTILAT